LFIEGSDGHSNFLPDISGSELTIRWGNDWNIGIDNINFDQQMNPVPLPSALGLLGFGLLGLFGIIKKSAKELPL